MQIPVVFSLIIAVASVHADDSFSLEDQAIWIDRLNYFRTTGLPWSAGDMCRIGWSSDLAMTAASTAAKCSATTAPGMNVYQSSTKSSSVIDEAIQQWVVETSMTTLKTLTQPGASDVEVGKGTYNSYSQILWAATTSVGCASASCSGGEMVVCEFSPAGNDGSSAWYIHADTASKCPSGTTALQGLCIVEGDAANNQIAPIPAGKLTYEVYPAYVANMQTVLIEAARGIAKGETQTAPLDPTAATTPSAVTTTTTTATTATTALPTSSSLKTSSEEDGSATKTSAAKTTPSSSLILNYSSSSEETSASLMETDKTSTSTKSDKTTTSTSTKTDKTITSSSSTDPSSESSTKEKLQTTTPSSGKEVPEPGKVKASSDTGSTFTNQDTSTEQTTPDTSSDEDAAASAPTPDSDTSTSINNKSSESSGSGISVAGMAGMIVLAIVGVAAFGVVVSYKRNQRRQREIMRDGGIRII